MFPHEPKGHYELNTQDEIVRWLERIKSSTGIARVPW